MIDFNGSVAAEFDAELRQTEDRDRGSGIVHLRAPCPAVRRRRRAAREPCAVPGPTGKKAGPALVAGSSQTTRPFRAATGASCATGAPAAAGTLRPSPCAAIRQIATTSATTANQTTGTRIRSKSSKRRGGGASPRCTPLIGRDRVGL